MHLIRNTLCYVLLIAVSDRQHKISQTIIKGVFTGCVMVQLSKKVEIFKKFNSMSFLEYANMYEVIIYFDEDYYREESITVSKSLSKKEITKIVNDRYGEGNWYEFEIF